jgi:tryptophanyl-tRNA synthetase
MFVQSRVPEHAELHLLLSMITPLSWLERVPSTRISRKAQGEGPRHLRLPRVSAAAVRRHPALPAGLVPVGEDQVAHVEITREIARRFNHLYGREPDFEAKAEKADQATRQGTQQLYVRQLRRKYQETGDAEASRRRAGSSPRTSASPWRSRAPARLPRRRRKRLDPAGAAGAVDADPEMPGSTAARCRSPTATRSGCVRTGQSVRRSCARCRPIRRACVVPIPAIRRKCPVWTLHEIYSDETTRKLGAQGCRSAGIGCLECKKPLIEKVVEEVGGMRKRAQEFEENPEIVRNIVAEGAEKARERRAPRSTTCVVPCICEWTESCRNRI